MAVREAILDFVDKFSGFKTAGFLKTLRDSEKLSAEEKEAGQWERVKNILDLAYRNSSFYQNLFSKAGLHIGEIKNSSDYKKVPIITPLDVIKYRSEIIIGREDLFIQSAGTNRSFSSKTIIDFNCAAKKYALYLRHLLKAGWDFDTDIFYFLPKKYKTKIVDIESGFKQLFSTYIQNKIAHNFLTRRKILFYDDLNPVIDKKILQNFRALINSSEKCILMGRAEFLYLLADNLKERDLEIKTPQSIVNIGGLLPLVILGRLKFFFKTEVYDIYGSSELSYIAGSRNGEKDLYVNEETHLVEIEKLEGTDNLGKIIVTDLLNETMPFIRYEVGDVGRILRKNEKGISLLEVSGRQRNLVLSRDGHLVSEKEICEAVFADEDVLQFCLKIDKDKMLLELVSKKERVREAAMIGRLGALWVEPVKIAYYKRIPEDFLDKWQYVVRS